MGSVNDFAACVTRIEDTPSPFHEALLQRILKTETVRHLIFSPAFAAGKFRAFASLLCVTERRWLILLHRDDGRVTVDESSYDATLLVEVTIILLYGQLKINFVINGEGRTTALQFNAVMQPSYSDAIQTILDTIDRQEHTTSERGWIRSPIISGWPLKFRNFSIIYVPEKSQLLDGVCWRESRGSFNRELAPAAALLLTDRHIVVIAEEKSSGWFQFGHRAKYGGIMTYLPLDRFGGFRVNHRKRFSIVELEGRKCHLGETIKIMIPLDKQEAVSHLMEKADSLRRLQPSSNL